MTLNDLGIVRIRSRRADRATVDQLARFGAATILETMDRVGLTAPLSTGDVVVADDDGVVVVPRDLAQAAEASAKREEGGGNACPAAGGRPWSRQLRHAGRRARMG